MYEVIDIDQGANMAALRICEAYNASVSQAWEQWQDTLQNLPGYPIHSREGSYEWPAGNYLVRFASEACDVPARIWVRARLAEDASGENAKEALRALHVAHAHHAPLLPTARRTLYETVAAGTVGYAVTFQPMQQGLEESAYDITLPPGPLQAEVVAGEIRDEYGVRSTKEFYETKAAEYTGLIARLHGVFQPEDRYSGSPV